MHVKQDRHCHQPAMQLLGEYALPEENQGGHLHWQAPQVDHDILDVMSTEPEDPPVLVPVEDHVAEDPVDVPRRFPEHVGHTDLTIYKTIV